MCIYEDIFTVLINIELLMSSVSYTSVIWGLAPPTHRLGRVGKRGVGGWGRGAGEQSFSSPQVSQGFDYAGVSGEYTHIPGLNPRNRGQTVVSVSVQSSSQCRPSKGLLLDEKVLPLLFPDSGLHGYK